MIKRICVNGNSVFIIILFLSNFQTTHPGPSQYNNKYYTVTFPEYSVVRHHFHIFDTRGATEFTIRFMIVLYFFSPSHIGSCTLRVSTFATIVDHTFISSVIDSSRPCSLMSLLIVSIHLMRGLPLGLFPGISISSTVLVMSSGFLRFPCPY